VMGTPPTVTDNAPIKPATRMNRPTQTMSVMTDGR
jgi:hypothetical protein